MVKGILRVVVNKARDLPPKDYGTSLNNPKMLCKQPMQFMKNLISKNSSDPYLQVEVGSVKERSQVVKNTLNPEFNFICEIPIEHTGAQGVKISFFDKDILSKDDFIGSCQETLEFLKENYKLPSPPEWRNLCSSTAQGTICHRNDNTQLCFCTEIQLAHPLGTSFFH